jgi:cytochrome c553
MIKQAHILVLVFASLVISSPAWPQSSSTEAVSSMERAALLPSRQQLEQGRVVADSACANCHGTDGISTAPGIPNLAGQRTVYLYRALQAYQSRERRNDTMNHEIGFLNNESLLAVSAYFASLPPARPSHEMGEAEPIFSANLSEGDPFADIRDAMKKCVKCHGEDGNSSASGMPNLSAQSTGYFVTSMKDYMKGERDHKMMKKLVANLDDEQLEKMGVFYAVQEPAQTATVGEGNANQGSSLAGQCANCHGEDGNASAPEMPSLAGQDARYFIKAMQAYKNGKRQHQPMFDAVESLDEREIIDLAAFYASQEPVRRNVRAPLTTAEWIDRCERCHGSGGNSTDPRFPMLAGQDRTYLINALQSYAGASRSNSTMHAMSAPLATEDIETIAGYYSNQVPKSVIYMQLPCEDPSE